jgi:biopolymer transport protein ExbD
MANINLRVATGPKSLISLVPMIDVMMILLVFFMVTSTYLDLDMMPAVQKSDEASETTGFQPDQPLALIIRIGSGGSTAVRGQPLDRSELSDLIRLRLAVEPLTPLVLLPSGGADIQALVSTMDIATLAGATRLRIIRLEGRP